MGEAITPLPNTPSWRGAQLKTNSTGTTLPLPFIICTNVLYDEPFLGKSIKFYSEVSKLNSPNI
jgi:hypothetical protein